MKFVCVLLFCLVLLSSFSLAQSIDDVQKIMYKLKGQDSLIQPPDSRSVQQIYEALEENKISELLTKVTDESLVKKLWDEIQTSTNRKDLLKSGLKDQKSKELLEVWEEISDERDFIIAAMDELSENGGSEKNGFNDFTQELLKENNPGVATITFEWDDLNRYFLEYYEQGVDPEHVSVKYDTGESLFLLLRSLPQGVTHIVVSATSITYENGALGKVIINISDMYPQTYEGEQKWELKGFTDKAGNSYDVFIDFGKSRNGVIKTIEGGFIIDAVSGVVIDDRVGTRYSFSTYLPVDSSFVLYDSGLYVFFGNVNALFPAGSLGSLNISESTIDTTGTLMDLFDLTQGNPSQIHSDLALFLERHVRFIDDSMYSGEKILTGNFNLIKGRNITVHSDRGFGFEFSVISSMVHSGHVAQNRGLLFSYGVLYAHRSLPGVSDVLFGISRVGSTFVDLLERRGSENGGLTFADYFIAARFFVDRIVVTHKDLNFLTKNGFFR